MIKVDIVNEVSKIADITKVKAEVAVDAVFDAMRTSMQRGERIELRGFGVFQVKPRKRGIGRNPRTGKEVRIPPGRTIRFKPGKDLQNIGRSAPFSGGSLLRTTLGFRRPSRDSTRRSHGVRLVAAASEVPGPALAAPALFVLTFVTTTLSAPGTTLVSSPTFSRAGACLRCDVPASAASGTACTILAILGCHEFGHYFACRYYNVDASLPFFLPDAVPPHRHDRRRHPDSRADSRPSAMLFDIGIAGPIAGFVVAVPALFWAGDVARRQPAAERSPATRSASRCSSRSPSWLLVGHAAGRLFGEHSSDGIRGMVRHARDGAEPVPDRPARRRPHLVCGPRPALVVG